MADVSNDLLYEVLKTMQRDVHAVRGDVRALKQEMNAVRGHLIAIQQDVRQHLQSPRSS